METTRCEICDEEVSRCECPICPVCNAKGRYRCYDPDFGDGLLLTMKQVEGRWKSHLRQSIDF